MRWRRLPLRPAIRHGHDVVQLHVGGRHDRPPADRARPRWSLPNDPLALASVLPRLDDPVRGRAPLMLQVLGAPVALGVVGASALEASSYRPAHPPKCDRRHTSSPLGGCALPPAALGPRGWGLRERVEVERAANGLKRTRRAQSYPWSEGLGSMRRVGSARSKARFGSAPCRPRWRPRSPGS
jgi:hypothetical protein